MSAIIDEWRRTVEGFAKPYEEALGRLVDGLREDPRAVGATGAWLGFGAALKERADRALEDGWTRARLCSAADVERIHERLGAIEGALARIEAGLAGGHAGGLADGSQALPGAGARAGAVDTGDRSSPSGGMVG